MKIEAVCISANKAAHSLLRKNGALSTLLSNLPALQPSLRPVFTVSPLVFFCVDVQDVWGVLSDFIGESRVHGTRPGSGLTEVPTVAAGAVDAVSTLLASYPIPALFALLTEATLTNDSPHVRVVAPGGILGP